MKRSLFRSQWPRGLRRGSADTRLLGLRVRIPPGAWMSVSCECCVVSGRGFCGGLMISCVWWCRCVASCCRPLEPQMLALFTDLVLLPRNRQFVFPVSGRFGRVAEGSFSQEYLAGPPPSPEFHLGPLLQMPRLPAFNIRHMYISHMYLSPDIQLRQERCKWNVTGRQMCALVRIMLPVHVCLRTCPDRPWGPPLYNAFRVFLPG